MANLQPQLQSPHHKLSFLLSILAINKHDTLAFHPIMKSLSVSQYQWIIIFNKSLYFLFGLKFYNDQTRDHISWNATGEESIINHLCLFFFSFSFSFSFSFFFFLFFFFLFLFSIIFYKFKHKLFFSFSIFFLFYFL